MTEFEDDDKTVLIEPPFEDVQKPVSEPLEAILPIEPPQALETKPTAKQTGKMGYYRDGLRARVCIDPGHGLPDPGAIGHGLQEQAIALAVCKELVYQLDLLGVDGYLTRLDENGLSLSTRVEKSKGAICFVSVHCNAAENPNAEGIESIYAAPGGAGKALANSVQQSLMSLFPTHKNRGLKMSPSPQYERSLYVLRAALVPATLVELEFLSHVEKGKALGEADTQKKFAYALAQGILSFVKSVGGIELKVVDT